MDYNRNQRQVFVLYKVYRFNSTLPVLVEWIITGTNIKHLYPQRDWGIYYAVCTADNYQFDKKKINNLLNQSINQSMKSNNQFIKSVKSINKTEKHQNFSWNQEWTEKLDDEKFRYVYWKIVPWLNSALLVVYPCKAVEPGLHRENTETHSLQEYLYKNIFAYIYIIYIWLLRIVMRRKPLYLV